MYLQVSLLIKSVTSPFKTSNNTNIYPTFPYIHAFDPVHYFNEINRDLIQFWLANFKIYK